MNTKEQSILDSALNLFVTKGFHGTATSAIAEQAGISNGTLFHYFKSKEVLVQQLHQRIKSDQITFITTDLEETESPKEKIRVIWNNAIKWAMENKDKYKFLHQYKYSPYKKKHKGDVEKFRKDFLDNAEKGVQLKQLRYLPYDFIFDMTNAHVYGMVEYLRSNPIKYRTPEFMKQAFESFYGSIKP
ncbi:MAG: TetR/AcrR family transcriptional regulator [Vicingaceae bacterium]